ncbi:glycosyltransferase involved in cell wall biosynthesis [Nocardioides zeae]|uniref:Glycosyltransferase involved in cell wall biosynthesis n=1 Tax=Nocardioides zeae TaxID=1457234 RepID=A0ACC6ILU7_9ACTN|nr:glycosyltransferase [Nocardioides zeae]MDR6173967.1 glycosyltransferase involved in cell wall biosynthesis [Nocardioides zeae]MDR6211477.1 glycosyltransferase involved in cell wall biosynthesis [Nocardioides zeae]
MRVAYVSTDPGIDVLGTKGASVHVQAVVAALLRRGAEVDLLTPRADETAAADLAAHPRLRIHRLPRVGRGEPAARERAARASDAAVAGLLDELHASPGTGSTRPLDLVYERYALWGRTATAWAAARGVPSLLEVNAPLPVEQARHRVLVDAPAAYDAARAALTAATAVIGVSPAVSDWAASLGADPVTTIGNGVDTRRVVPAARPVHDGRPDPARPFTLGFVGTLKGWHGVDTLLAALALLGPGHRLLVVGDGPTATDLRATADRLGVADRVTWTGAVPAAAVPALLQEMDVACAPYPPLDGFYFSPLKVTEYLAAGLPVVASDVGGLRALLCGPGGAGGDLVPPGDAAALADAVADLRDDVVRRRALRATHRRAALALDWDHVVEASLATLPHPPVSPTGATRVA